MSNPRQIALLRGVNVGRAKRIAMADLRALIGALGHGEVRTVLNSGNAVFDGAGRTPAETAGRIEAALRERLDLSVRVGVLAAAQLAELVRENSLLPGADDASRLLAAVFIDPPERGALAALLAQDWAPDGLALGRHAAYLWCPDGVLASRAAPALNKLLGETTTARNWATILKLHALAQAD